MPNAVFFTKIPLTVEKTSHTMEAMRAWNIPYDPHLTFILAADARLGGTDYCDDQIWELAMSGGDPPALAVQTTFGLRAYKVRLFPRFLTGDEERIDPAGFASPPVVHQFAPNFVRLSYRPFEDIDVHMEYWVPQSQVLAGRIWVTNRSAEPTSLRLEWIGQLTPTEGERMAPAEIKAAPVLAGSSGDLQPVVFLSGGPQADSSSYPALRLNLDLIPQEQRQFTWVHAALPEREASFDLARSTAARNWEAECARVEMFNTGQVEIYTGNPEWDLAFALAQKTAYGLFSGPTEHLPAPSFVLSRLPDQGYSLRGNGSDYNFLWSGQPSLEAYYLSSLLLPAATGLVKGVLRNFLFTQDESGMVDWKPSLSGQTSRVMAAPVLASLAWQIYLADPDRDFLGEVFPALLKFLFAWFSPEHDHDGDGIPEWDNAMQAGLEDIPTFSHWNEWSLGIDIGTTESPALCAFLVKECESLLNIAAVLGQEEGVAGIQEIAARLRAAVEETWQEETSSYHYRDRDTHLTPQGEWLGQRAGPGTISLHRQFDRPVRLQCHIRTSGESTRRPQIFVHGSSASGSHRVERITEERFKWYLGAGSFTGDRVYTAIEEVEIQGLDPADQVTLTSVGLDGQDHSLLLPLWAGIPSIERARELVERTVCDPLRYWRPYGIPACPYPPPQPEALGPRSVSMLWNSLIGEGLVRYGFRDEAVELFNRLMAAVLQNLKQEGSFRRLYHADRGEGYGERSALYGLPPLGLFLQILGIQQIAPNRVQVCGFNPFPWPVTVKYRGMTVLCQKEKTMVIFPDGQTAVVRDPDPHVVTLETEAAASG